MSKHRNASRVMKLVTINKTGERIMTTELKLGDACYDERGNEYQYISAVPGGYLVSAVIEVQGSYDEPPYVDFGKPEFTSRVYPVAPVVKRSEMVSTLDDQIQEKRKELSEIESKIRELNRSEKDLQERLKRHSVMERIDDILGGKITHYAVLDSYAVKSAFEDTDRYQGKKYRLLSLSPSIIRGTIHWQINDWSDGSGTDRDVIPCTTEEEAIGTIKTEMESQWSDWLMAANPVVKDRLYKASLDYGVDVPKEYMGFLAGIKKTQLLAVIERDRQILADNEKLLAELENDHATRI